MIPTASLPDVYARGLFVTTLNFANLFSGWLIITISSENRQFSAKTSVEANKYGGHALHDAGSFTAWLCCAAAVAQDFHGKVVAVTDGDTIQVMHHNIAETIRLAGIDCPEKSQQCGMKAKEFTTVCALEKTWKLLEWEKIDTGAPSATQMPKWQDTPWVREAICGAFSSRVLRQRTARLVCK
jgi:hypothetical protein